MRTKSNAALALFGLALAGAPDAGAQPLPSRERLQEGCRTAARPSVQADGGAALECCHSG